MTLKTMETGKMLQLQKKELTSRFKMVRELGPLMDLEETGHKPHVDINETSSAAKDLPGERLLIQSEVIFSYTSRKPAHP